MGSLRFVGSLKSQVSFAKEPYKRDYVLIQSTIIQSTQQHSTKVNEAYAKCGWCHSAVSNFSVVVLGSFTSCEWCAFIGLFSQVSFAKEPYKCIMWIMHLLFSVVVLGSLIVVLGRGGGLGSSTIFKKLMSPTPRRKWYLTTGRRAH